MFTCVCVFAVVEAGDARWFIRMGGRKRGKVTVEKTHNATQIYEGPRGAKIVAIVLAVLALLARKAYLDSEKVWDCDDYRCQ